MTPTADIPTAISCLDMPIVALAAMLGEEFSLDWILAISGEKPTRVLSAMEEAIDKSILNQTQPGIYAFVDLERQMECLTSYSETERAALHRQLADIIQDEFPDDLDMLPVSARQLMQTTNGIDDCRRLFETGESLRKTFRQQDAMLCYKKAIDDLRTLGGQEADRLFIDAALMYARIFSTHEDPEWIVGILEEAVARAEGTSVQTFQALLKMHLAKFEWYRGRQSVAIRQFDKGWAIAQASENPDVKRYATTLRVFFFYWQGRYRDVVRAYEESPLATDRYPRSGFPLLATCILGESLARTGRVTEGLGMLTEVHKHYREIGSIDNLGYALRGLTYVFLEIGRLDEASKILEETGNALSEGRAHSYNHFEFHRDSARSLALRQEYDEAAKHLSEIGDHAGSSTTYLITMDGLIQMAVDMADGDLLRLCNRGPEQISQSAVRSKNIFVRGMGHLFRACLLRKRGRPAKEVFKSFRLSLKWLGASGNELQLAKARFEVARTYLQIGDRVRARREVLKSQKVLGPINPSLIPEDLSSLLKETSVKEGLLDEITALGQEIGTIRDNREIASRILSTICQLTGTERGAIFETAGPSAELEIRLQAARNLTDHTVSHPDFGPSLDIIRETISSGVGRIIKMQTSDDTVRLSHHHAGTVRSCFCVPMILGGKVTGAFYHDNSIFDSYVKEADLDALTFLAAQAAIALDNARAYERINQLNRQLMDENQYYMEKEVRRSPLEDIVGESPAMQRVFDQIGRVAAQDTTVLIQGETGVGKELIARAIQNRSGRRERPFISADCSALSETVITSELFGHEKGAFTGAHSRRIGRFELAHGGTLFLDEIGNVPMEVQMRLLRVLQTKEFQRVGGLETIHSDFRLITATNRDLGRAVADGRFREDLYYRLNAFPVTVPPLRERGGDIPLLALYFLRRYSLKTGKSYGSMSKAEMAKLLDYPWPGNVRELQSIIERGTILSDDSHFRVPELVGNPSPSLEAEIVTLAEHERRYILRVLEETGGKVGGKSGAARLLGLPDSTLFSRMRKLGIKPNRSQVS